MTVKYLIKIYFENTLRKEIFFYFNISVSNGMTLNFHRVDAIDLINLLLFVFSFQLRMTITIDINIFNPTAERKM